MRIFFLNLLSWGSSKKKIPLDALWPEKHGKQFYSPKIYSLLFQSRNSIFNIVPNYFLVRIIGWPKMHEVFKSLLPRYFLKDVYVKWSQFEFQTIWSNFHYSSRRSKFLLTIIVLAKFRLKMIFEFFLIKVSQKL